MSILQAARAVFARQGYANTVVDDIATQAGIAKGTLYLYFPPRNRSTWRHCWRRRGDWTPTRAPP